MEEEYTKIQTERQAVNCLTKHRLKRFSDLSRQNMIDIIESLIILGRPTIYNNYNKLHLSKGKK